MRGAAVLAGLGIGLYATPDVGIEWTNQPVARTDTARSARLERAYTQCISLHPPPAAAFAASA